MTSKATPRRWLSWCIDTIGIILTLTGAALTANQHPADLAAGLASWATGICAKYFVRKRQNFQKAAVHLTNGNSEALTMDAAIDSAQPVRV